MKIGAEIARKKSVNSFFTHKLLERIIQCTLSLDVEYENSSNTVLCYLLYNSIR